MQASNELCKELIPKYKDFKELKNIKTFIGYKLVSKKNLNYYSIVTGLFRYKPGKIGRSSYSVLYEKNKEYYQEHLKDRLAICTNVNDAKNMLSSFNENNPNENLVILKIEISGELEKAISYNKNCNNVDVVIGNKIESIKEI